MEYFETVIVGGGQAGLATSYYLKQHGREHVVLEQADRAGSSWQAGRWDSFTLVTPKWAMRMPGAENDDHDRDEFMPRERVVAYFQEYAARFELPVRYNTRVVAVEPLEEVGYRVQTSEGAVAAKNVVIATGFEQLPRVPPASDGLSSAITQLHSSMYRNPQRLPPGAVLVVGSGQSGCQIAEELYLSGRRVYLSTSGVGRAPRRYRGKDTFEWLFMLGFFEVTPERLPYPKEQFTPPHLSGVQGGRSLNLHQFVRDGVTLLGRLVGAQDDRVFLAPDLHENLGKADGFEQEVKKMVDGYIQKMGLDAPEEDLPQMRDGYNQPIIEELDLTAEGIKTVIWATGYMYDYSLIKLPIFHPDGFPIQANGVTPAPGVYLVGMPWMPALKTGILLGVGESARTAAENIVGMEIQA